MKKILLTSLILAVAVTIGLFFGFGKNDDSASTPVVVVNQQQEVVPTAVEFARRLQEKLVTELTDLHRIDSSEPQVKRFLSELSPEVLEESLYLAQKDQLTGFSTGLRLVLGGADPSETYQAHVAGWDMSEDHWLSIVESSLDEDLVVSTEKLASRTYSQYVSDTLVGIRPHYERAELKKRICATNEQEFLLARETTQSNSGLELDESSACTLFAHEWFINRAEQSVDPADSKKFADWQQYMDPFGASGLRTVMNDGG